MRKSLPILVTFLVIASITGAAIAADTTASGSTPAGVVNINTADAAQLSLLPRVGQKAAARIIEYRQKKGPFKKIEELMNVQGIGEKNFLKLRSQLTVGARTEPAGQQ